MQNKVYIVCVKDICVYISMCVCMHTERGGGEEREKKRMNEFHRETGN